MPSSIWTKLFHFRKAEFNHPDELDPKLVHMLDMAREICGHSFSIGSDFRTKAHNEAIGGAKASAHLTGKAIDIRCSSSTIRWDMVEALKAVGFRRIEVCDRHVHVDLLDDELHPSPCLMVGKSR